MTIGRKGRSLSNVVIAAVGGALVGAGVAFALASHWQTQGDKRPGERRGHDIAALVCARCHAVGAEGQSPNPNAPPFRTLVDRLTDEGLQEQLEEGLPLGHSPMPPWNFSQEQEEDLLIYIFSLAPEKSDG